MTANTNGSVKPTSETVEKNRPGGVDQPLTRFMPQAMKIAAPHIEPKPVPFTLPEDKELIME